MGEKMQEGLLNTYLESGFFPEWASPGHRGCMVGNNSASVVADAFMKNVTKADAEKMYDGLLKGANSVHPKVSTTGRRGYEYYNKLFPSVKASPHLKGLKGVWKVPSEFFPRINLVSGSNRLR